MILNVTFVTQWWKYKTRSHQYVLPVAVQWLESGQPQPLSSMAQASTQQEDSNESI